MLLQGNNDLEQIRRRRISLRPEHLVQRLAMNPGLLRQLSDWQLPRVGQVCHHARRVALHESAGKLPHRLLCNLPAFRSSLGGSGSQQAGAKLDPPALAIFPQRESFLR